MKKIESLEEYQSYLRAMLCFLDDFCRKNGINYTVVDGTLLGAVRNKGMIPWDGDVDVAVTHKELEKLKKAFEGYKGRYFFCYFPDHYIKKRGMKKAYHTITAKIVDSKCDSGLLGIDVFTIDFLGNDWAFANETIRLYKKFYKRQLSSIAFHLPAINKRKSYFRNALGVILRMGYPLAKIISIFSSPTFKREYQSFLRERLLFNENSSYFSVEPYLGRIGIEKNTILDGGYVDLPFDSITVMAVRNYDAYLIPTYGDYYSLPPEEKRVPYPSLDELMECNIEIDEELKSYLRRVNVVS